MPGRRGRPRPDPGSARDRRPGSGQAIRRTAAFGMVWARRGGNRTAGDTRLDAAASAPSRPVTVLGTAVGFRSRTSSRRPPRPIAGMGTSFGGPIDLFWSRIVRRGIRHLTVIFGRGPGEIDMTAVVQHRSILHTSPHQSSPDSSIAFKPLKRLTAEQNHGWHRNTSIALRITIITSHGVELWQHQALDLDLHIPAPWLRLRMCMLIWSP